MKGYKFKDSEQLLQSCECKTMIYFLLEGYDWYNFSFITFYMLTFGSNYSFLFKLSKN